MKKNEEVEQDKLQTELTLNRRNILLSGGSLIALAATAGTTVEAPAARAAEGTAAGGSKPNILIIWGDDIGWSNVSAYNMGMMGYKTPNIDRIAKEGAMFTDWYGQQSCTAGRACFITGQVGYRTGLLKVGLPGAKEGLQARDVTIAELLKGQGYVTGQFARTTSVILTSICPPRTASMSSSARCTT